MDIVKVVHLNVGGTLFVTDEYTLKKDRTSQLASIRMGQKGGRDSERCYFIDRDGTHFSHILQYLRDGTIPPADVAVQVHKEAQFYGLAALVERLEMVGPVHDEIVMEKLRSEIPNYKETLDKIINIARRKFLQRHPAKPTTEVWIGTRYDHGDAPFHATAHACEFQPQYNSQDISAENTVSLVFTGQKDAVHYTIRENLPTIIHHDLTE
ncbi:BTB/POZ domain-containing protein KCTD7-like [Ptychodera flava]|uniref:BTB/POZ domain-containing protein KCTD7-like n=1 Tax=Ptychodera flava TaxID=63121 RepID=UPI00396A9A9C